jgi:O-antigen ligase
MTFFLLIFVALGALAGVAAILLRPMWAFLLILIMFALEQLLQSYFNVFQSYPALFNYIVGLVAVLAVGLRVLQRTPITSGLNNPVTYLIFAQFALWLGAMLYSPAPDVASGSLRAAWQPLILFLAVMPLLVVDLPEFRRILVAVMLVGSIMAALIILNPRSTYYSGRMVLDLGMTGLRKDQYGNPLAVAELGGMVALVAALIMPTRRSGLFTALRIGAFTAGMGLAIGSGSRGQVLATAVAGILFYPAARRLNSIRNFFLTAFGLLTLMVGVYFAFQLFIGEQNRERWDIRMMVEDISGRFEMVWLFLDAWIASPSHWLFGLGTNAWADVYGASDVGGNYVHNIAVEVLCEHGLVGAAILIATVVLTVRAGVRMWSLHRDDPALRSAAAVFLALGAFMLFNSLKQGSITSGAPFFIWLVLAKISRREESLLASNLAREESKYALAEPMHATQPGYAMAR